MLADKIRSVRLPMVIAALATLTTSALAQATDQSAPVLTAEEFSARALVLGSEMPINCTIRPLRVVELTSALPGVVKEVFVVPGQAVNVGDPIVRLDDTAILAELALAEMRASGRAGLTIAETRAEGAERKAKRIAEAFSRNAVSPSDNEAAQTEAALSRADVDREREILELSRLELERVRALLGQTLITAPVAGLVGEDLVDPGEATSQKPIATIYVNQPLRVEAFVPSTRLEGIVSATTHTIRIGDGNRAYEPVFDYASQVADIASGTISVFFKLDAPEVLPGTKCTLMEEIQ